MKPTSVLVIGAGVAGSACGIRLCGQKVKVTLVEQAEFPREKVCGCCLGGAGLETLKQLGTNLPISTQPAKVGGDLTMETDNLLFQQIMTQGTALTGWHASMGGRKLEVNLPRGLAISRSTLDPILLQAAKDAGCIVRQPCKARITDIDSSKIRVSLQTGRSIEELEFDVVVLATGLNSQGVNSVLPWTESPHGPFGVSWTADNDELLPHVIYMACDDDGYVGLVRLESGRVDIAAALRSGSDAAQRGTPADRVQQILQRSRFPDFQWNDMSKVMTTPPLRRTRLAGSGRILTVGDASGYVEPFTGEGMTWGLKSGIAAADMIGSCLEQAGQSQLAAIGDRWNQELKILLRRQKWTCRIVTGALRSGWIRGVAGTTLAAFPKLATPLIRHLN